MLDNIPEKISFEYDFVRKIGEGANGETWLAKNRINRTLAAIKCLKLNAANDFKSFELFKREVNLLKSIQVEGVPKFYDAYISDALEQSFLIQEYIDAPSIQDIMDRTHSDSHESNPSSDATENSSSNDVSDSDQDNPPEASLRFSEKETILIAKKIAKILVQLHTNYSPPIIHRDIKPSNILYNEHTQEVYLIDFGSVANPKKRTGGSTIAGTFGYMPPEQIFGDVAPQSDFYALGATMLHMLTGIMPYNLSSNVYQLDIDQALKTYAPNTSPGMNQLLTDLLSADIHKRPPSAIQLLKEIQMAELDMNDPSSNRFFGRCFHAVKKVFRKFKKYIIGKFSTPVVGIPDSLPVTEQEEPKQADDTQEHISSKIKNHNLLLKKKIVTIKSINDSDLNRLIKCDICTKDWVKCDGVLRRLILHSSGIFRDTESVYLVEYTFTVNTYTYKNYYPFPRTKDLILTPSFPIPCTILYNPKDPLQNGIYDFGDK